MKTEKKKIQKKRTTRKSKFIKLRGDRMIWLIVALLAMISIVSVFSSSNALAYKFHTTTFTFLLKQMLYVGIGLLCMVGCYSIPIGWYRKYSSPLLVLSWVLLFYTIFGGSSLNHARRWIHIWKFTFQPSEFAKIAIILYLGRTLEVFSIKTFKEYFIRILTPCAITIILCLTGSVSVAIIVAIICFIIIWIANIDSKFIWRTVGIALIGVLVIFGIHQLFGTFQRLDTFTARIERYVKGSDVKNMTEAELEEYNAKNYQAEQAKEAIQLGGIFGRGPGNSIKKDTLPHPYSDFIYTIIIEETGIIGAIVVLLLYIWFLFRCIAIAQACKKVFSTITVLGIGALITTQAFMHILVNVGILPVTGQTLPLISLGGSSTLVMGCAFGIVLSINRTIEIKIEKEKIAEKEAEAKAKYEEELLKSAMDDNNNEQKNEKEKNNN